MLLSHLPHAQPQAQLRKEAKKAAAHVISPRPPWSRLLEVAVDSSTAPARPQKIDRPPREGDGHRVSGRGRGASESRVTSSNRQWGFTGQVFTDSGGKFVSERLTLAKDGEASPAVRVETGHGTVCSQRSSLHSSSRWPARWLGHGEAKRTALCQRLCHRVPRARKEAENFPRVPHHLTSSGNVWKSGNTVTSAALPPVSERMTTCRGAPGEAGPGLGRLSRAHACLPSRVRVQPAR